jgi:outer membrane biosynthesis protein TonB
MAMSASTSSGLSRQEALALFVALAAHVALIGGLTLAPPGKTIMSPPERMTVTFADEIADQSVSPDPNAEAAPDIAPVLGEPAPEPAPPEPAPVVPPQPKPVPQPVPQPKPQPAPRPAPKPVPQPRAMPAPPKPVAKPVAKPAPPKPAAAAADARPRRRPDAPSGGSRLGNDFLSGIPGSTNPGTARTPPAAAFGPEVAASLVSGIARQIKPHWTAPQGVDADKLVTVLAWSLNPDGSLAGKPVVVQQLGISDANRAQAQRHAEQAIRAVQLAAPFELPAPYYAKWKRVSSFRFDRKLSQ